MNKITKISTIYRKEREMFPEKFQTKRDEFLEIMVKSKPRMNVRINISSKVF